MTANRGMILPLFAAAVVADVAARAVSGRRLYHGLADGLREEAVPETKKAPEASSGA